ncbi:MAG TPA: response regulator [bacterium]|nr:response regulator [bacterium]
MSLNVLIVDDSTVVRKIISKTLKLTGIPINEFHDASNGKEALEVLNDEWIDIVFTDINMPVMGGVKMIEKMNQDGMMQTIPVIVISTEGSETRIEQLSQQGVKAYLRKPVTPEKLRDVVKDILGIKDEE